MNNGRLPAWVLLLLYLAPQTRGLPTLPIDGTSTAIGFNHVCALTPTYDRSTGGVVVCSGNNDFGKALPPQELTFVQLAAGMYFTCGLHIDQTVHCWGSIAAYTPSGLFLQLSAGNYFACGLLAHGQLLCWGHGRVVGLINSHADDLRYDQSFVQLSCGPEHCCAVDSGGSLICWGAVDRSTPSYLHTPRVEIEAGIDGDTLASSLETPLFQQISVGAEVSCGVTHPRRDLLCWGSLEKHIMTANMTGPFIQVEIGIFYITRPHINKYIVRYLPLVEGLVCVRYEMVDLPSAGDKLAPWRPLFETGCGSRLRWARPLSVPWE
jgi:hypothetical protein